MTRPVCYDFPLRPPQFAQFVLPRDLTKAEAARICAFLMSLARPTAALADREVK